MSKGILFSEQPCSRPLQLGRERLQPSSYSGCYGRAQKGARLHSPILKTYQCLLFPATCSFFTVSTPQENHNMTDFQRLSMPLFPMSQLKRCVVTMNLPGLAKHYRGLTYSIHLPCLLLLLQKMSLIFLMGISPLHIPFIPEVEAAHHGRPSLQLPHPTLHTGWNTLIK